MSKFRGDLVDLHVFSYAVFFQGSVFCTIHTHSYFYVHALHYSLFTQKPEESTAVYKHVYVYVYIHITQKHMDTACEGLYVTLNFHFISLDVIIMQ